MRLILTALAAALSLAACGGNPDAPAPEGAKPDPQVQRQVNVYNWSDYIAPDTLDRFTRETGIRVVYDVYADNETLDAKLVAGQSGYDVVFPSAPFAQKHILNGLYAPLDRTLLPNIGNLDPALVQAVRVADPEGRHVVPYMWGTTGIGYNIGRIREILGPDFVVDSWAVLFDPAISGKLAQCGIAFLDDQQEAFSAALLFHGRDPNAMGGDEIELVTRTFAAVHPNIRYFDSSRYIDDLANGEICIAMGYNGDVLQARARAAEAGTGVEIGYAIPKEGAVRWFDVMAIPADAPNPIEAHAFIDFLLRPDVIAPITEYVSFASANAAAKPLVSEALRNDPAVYPPEAVLAKLHDVRKLPLEENDARQRAWTSIRAGR